MAASEPVLQHMKSHMAQAFLDSITKGDITVYAYLGDPPQPWDSETAPDAVDQSVDGYWQTWRDIYALKKINASDISLACRRVNWVKDTRYIEYDSATNHFANPDDFYVLVMDDVDITNNKIYKCISNNSEGKSTARPNTKITGVFGTQSITGDEQFDGYKWILIGQVEHADAEKWLTEDFFPVKKLTADNNTLQWLAQQQAVSGTVERVEIVTAGASYTNGTYTLNIVSGGSDGTGFVATATVANNAVSAVTVLDSGQNYSKIELEMPSTSGGTGATFRGVLSPFGGHGSDIVRELKPEAVMVYTIIDGTEDGVVSTANDFRQYGLLINPTDSNGAALTGDVYSMATEATIGTITNNSADKVFTLDEWVYVGETFATATKKARVLEWKSSAATVIKLVDPTGTFAASDIIKGNTSGSKATISSIDASPTPKVGSGEFIHSVNRTNVSRDDEQRDLFQIAIEF